MALKLKLGLAGPPSFQTAMQLSMRGAVSGQWVVDSSGPCIVLLILPLQGGGSRGQQSVGS